MINKCLAQNRGRFVSSPHVIFLTSREYVHHSSSNIPLFVYPMGVRARCLSMQFPKISRESAPLECAIRFSKSQCFMSTFVCGQSSSKNSDSIDRPSTQYQASVEESSKESGHDDFQRNPDEIVAELDQYSEPIDMNSFFHEVTF